MLREGGREGEMYNGLGSTLSPMLDSEVTRLNSNILRKGVRKG